MMHQADIATHFAQLVQLYDDNKPEFKVKLKRLIDEEQFFPHIAKRLLDIKQTIQKEVPLIEDDQKLYDALYSLDAESVFQFYLIDPPANDSSALFGSRPAPASAVSKAFPGQRDLYKHRIRDENGKLIVRFSVDVLAGHYWILQYDPLFEFTYRLERIHNFILGNDEDKAQVAVHLGELLDEPLRAHFDRIRSQLGCAFPDCLTNATAADASELQTLIVEDSATQNILSKFADSCRERALDFLKQVSVFKDFRTLYARIILLQQLIARSTILSWKYGAEGDSRQAFSFFPEQKQLAEELLQLHPGPGHVIFSYIAYQEYFHRDFFYQRPHLINHHVPKILCYENTEMQYELQDYQLVEAAFQHLKYALTNQKRLAPVENNAFYWGGYEKGLYIFSYGLGSALTLDELCNYYQREVEDVRKLFMAGLCPLPVGTALMSP